MESRRVYLGIALRVRGGACGDPSRICRHSMLTEALCQAVVERELIFQANLAHAVAVASLYGHPQMNHEGGWEQVHDMYVKALDTLPYIHAGKSAKVAKRTETDELVAEWHRLNDHLDDTEKKKEG